MGRTMAVMPLVLVITRLMHGNRFWGYMSIVSLFLQDCIHQFSDDVLSCRYGFYAKMSAKSGIFYFSWEYLGKTWYFWLLLDISARSSRILKMFWICVYTIVHDGGVIFACYAVAGCKTYGICGKSNRNDLTIQMPILSRAIESDEIGCDSQL